MIDLVKDSNGGFNADYLERLTFTEFIALYKEFYAEVD